jgi:hypothetical protein
MPLTYEIQHNLPYDRIKYTRKNLGIRSNVKVGDVYLIYPAHWYFENFPTLFRESTQDNRLPCYDKDGKILFWSPNVEPCEVKITKLPNKIGKNSVIVEIDQGPGYMWDAYLVPKKINRHIDI